MLSILTTLSTLRSNMRESKFITCEGADVPDCGLEPHLLSSHWGWEPGNRGRPLKPRLSYLLNLKRLRWSWLNSKFGLTIHFRSDGKGSRNHKEYCLGQTSFIGYYVNGASSSMLS